MESQIFIILFILSNSIKVWGSVLDKYQLEFLKQLGTFDFEPYGTYCSPELIQDSFKNTNEDVNLNGFEIMTKYGVNYEVYTVETRDGYRINFVRVPGDGPLVFVNHGLLSTFEDYFTPGTESGLGYVLRDAGYDIWFINCRGNVFSRNHTTLSPKDKKFWYFSWHEIGTEDLPACIDFALAKTGKTQLIYIGFSQGTTTALVLLSKKPEYNEKFKLVILLSPIVFLKNARSPFLKAIAPYHGEIYFMSSILGQDELLPSDSFIAALKNVICLPAIPLCNNFFLMIKGFDCTQLNYTALPVEVSKIPAGSSSRQVIHYLQLIDSNKFREYDHGEVKNLAVYGSIYPPDYILTNIHAPVAIFRASNDLMSDPRDVQTLVDQLPNVVENYLVPYEKFDHMDFVWAKDVNKLLYGRVLEVMKEYEN